MMVFAVDAGGTNCRLAMVSDETTEVVVTDAANATTNFNASTESILEGVHTLANRLSISSRNLAEIPAYLGVAGITATTISNKLKSRLPFKHIKIEDDRRCALRGAIGTQDGFVVHCGTGSFFATQKNSVSKFIGGWGPVLDDIASAHWLGIEALKHTLYAEDTLQPHTDMTRHLLTEFGSTANIVSYARDASTSDIASLAKTVSRYAASGDTSAKNIMFNGAAAIENNLRLFGYKNKDNVCFTGGLGGRYEPYLSKEIKPGICTPLGTPLDGAIALATEFYHEVKS